MSNPFDFNTAARAVVAATPQDTARRLEDLRAALKGRAPELVSELFPLARYEAGKARIGDASGAPGGSMVIEINGPKAGVWFDHNAGATDGEGDLIDLWRMGQGYDGEAGFWRAVEDLEQHLGMVAHKPRGLGPVARIAAERAKQPRPANATEIGRRTFVYTSADGGSVLAQVIRIDLDDGDKTYRQRNAAGDWKSPLVRPLYNLPGIVDAPSVVLVEGETCADALKALGLPATTLMGGSGTILAKSDLEPLRGKQVILWPDNDDAGRSFMLLVAPQLRAIGCDVRSVEIPDDATPAWDACDCAPNAALAMIAAAKVEPVPMVVPGALALVPQTRALKLLSLAELFAVKPPKWLIKGAVAEGCFAAIIGPHASYKSFVALDMAFCVANGRPWQGREVRQGPVVYVAGEGQAGVGQRALGWTQAKEGDHEAPFLTVPQGVAMPTGQLDELIGLIAAMDTPPALIILDTLARNFGTADENSSTDMGAFIAACDRLRLETGACVMVVHHTGKDLERGARGSNALPGGLDCMIGVKREGDRVTVINKAPIGKQKDAAEFDDIALLASEVRLDIETEDGEPMTTLVLIADHGLIASGDADAPKPGRAPSAQAAVLAVLQEAETAGHPGLGMTALKAKGLDKSRGLAAVLRTLVDQGKVRVDADGVNPIWSAV
jgi:hypothetical protein